MATKKVKFNKWNYKRNPKDKDWGKSLTVPSESMTVREMLNRHANGINFDNVKTPFYEEQASLTTKSIHELQKMDITDKLQYLEKHAEEVQNLKNKIEAYKQEQQENAQQNEVESANANASNVNANADKPKK